MFFKAAKRSTGFTIDTFSDQIVNKYIKMRSEAGLRLLSCRPATVSNNINIM